jgi:hypothetical protein
LTFGTIFSNTTLNNDSLINHYGLSKLRTNIGLKLGLVSSISLSNKIESTIGLEWAKLNMESTIHPNLGFLIGNDPGNFPNEMIQSNQDDVFRLIINELRLNSSFNMKIIPNKLDIGCGLILGHSLNKGNKNNIRINNNDIYQYRPSSSGRSYNYISPKINLKYHFISDLIGELMFQFIPDIKHGVILNPDENYVYHHGHVNAGYVTYETIESNKRVEVSFSLNYYFN